jgi:hypothetical protein
VHGYVDVVRRCGRTAMRTTVDLLDRDLTIAVVVMLGLALDESPLDFLELFSCQHLLFRGTWVQKTPQVGQQLWRNRRFLWDSHSMV